MTIFSKANLLYVIHVLERALAAIVLLVTLVYAINGIPMLFALDWAASASFFTALEYLLYIAIGIELARLLIDYSLETLVELLAFVIARKIIITPDNPPAVFLLVVTLFALFAMRFYFIKDADDAMGSKESRAAHPEHA